MSGPIPEHERGHCCPLCGIALPRPYQAPQASAIYDIACDACGRYTITSTFEDQLANPTSRSKIEPLVPFVRAHVRQATDRNHAVELTSQDYERLARSHMSTPVDAQLRRALDLIATQSRLGDWVEIDWPQTAMRLDARSLDEAQLILEHLRLRQLVEHRTQKPPYDGYGKGVATNAFRLTVEGWRTVSPLVGEGRSGLVFIAMSFDESMRATYNAIKASVETDCGLVAYRVDDIHHNDQITDRIITGIRAAQFTIAEVTGQKQGVYFEAGFAMGLGRSVIWCCRETEIDRVHFDTRQFNHVVWSDASDLRSRLTARIRGTILTPLKLTDDPF